MKELSIRILPPKIPDGVDILHVATSYRISKDIDFEVKSNILYESLEDNINLLELIVSLDIADDENVYVQTRYHFLDHGINKHSKWSLAREVKGNRHEIHYPDTVLTTPNVKPVLNENRVFYISTNEMKIFSGIGDHAKTSWKIKDSDGVAVYRRRDDVDNKVMLLPEFMPDDTKAYEVEAIHTATGNSDSYSGRRIFIESVKAGGIYEFEVISPFYLDSNVWHRLKIFVPNFKNYDLEIRTPEGEVVRKLTECGNLVYFISTYRFKLDQVYEWWLKVRFTDNSTTEWTLEHRAKAVDYKDGVEEESYLEKITDGPTFNPNNPNEGVDNNPSYTHLSNINSYEIVDGEFMWMSPNGRIILLKKEGNEINYVKDLYNLYLLNGITPNDKYDNVSIPYCTFTKLDQFDVLCHYRVLNNNDNFGATVFLRMFFNPLTKAVDVLNRLVIKDIDNGYGISNSIAKYDKRTYYAAYEQDPTIDVYHDGLRLLKLEITSEEMIASTYIAAKNGKYAYSKVIIGKKQKMFIVCGSRDSKTNMDNSELLYRRNIINGTKAVSLNKLVLDKPGSWEGLPDYYTALKDAADIGVDVSSRDVYDLYPVTLGTGDVLLFNNVNSGREMFNQNILVYSTTANVFRKIELDCKIKLPFRNTVKMRNWDIIRISSNIVSPQLAYTYLSTQHEADEFPEQSLEVEYPKYVKFDKSVVPIEIPYHYEDFDPNGDEEYEGIQPPYRKKLIWVDKSQHREFTMHHRLFTKSHENPTKEEGFPIEGIRSINILNNVHCKVRLGQCFGENSYDVGHGDNPYPHAPRFEFSPKALTMKVGQTLKVKFETNMPYFQVSNQSPGLVTVDYDEEKPLDKFMMVTAKGVGVATILVEVQRANYDLWEEREMTIFIV